MAIPIFLASTSPRRLELLTQAGFTFSTLAPHTDETPRPRESAEAMVKRLSRDKARSVVREIGQRPVLVIAADTTVVAPGGKRILGKPENLEEARAMVTSLAGRSHTVWTGYTLLLSEAGAAKPRELTRSVKSLVKMRKLTRAQVEAYVARGESMDKAGAYAAQGAGMALIEEIRGSYSNVVGLPIAQLMTDLEARFGVSPW